MRRVFKEIKRRARNVMLAARGKETRGQSKMEPVKIKIVQPVKIETFAAEQFIGPLTDEQGGPKVTIDCHRKRLAAEIGHKLLDEGAFTEEISMRPHELGLLGYTLRLTVNVALPEGAKP